MSGRILLLCTVILAAGLAEAGAHPHIFIDPAVTVTQTVDGRTGFNMSWTWDRGWSYRIIESCDLDENGIFSTEETDLVYREFFADLETFHYFTSIFINGQKLKFERVENFIANATKEQVVTFVFFIPVQTGIPQRSTVKIILNDDAYTIGFKGDLLVRSNELFTINRLKIKKIPSFGKQAEFFLDRN